MFRRLKTPKSKVFNLDFGGGFIPFGRTITHEGKLLMNKVFLP